MRHQKFLIFLVIPFLFIGSVLSEDDSNSKKLKNGFNMGNECNKTLNMFLKENPDYVVPLKLLILSPMIIAWTTSLICIASMCGVCYPFGLSEPSTKTKSNEKKAKKSSEKKEKKEKNKE